MKAEYTYQYDSEKYIMHKKHSGTFELKDILNSWDVIIKEAPYINDVRGYLLDYIDSSLKLNKRSDKKIINYFNSHEEVFGGAKFAIVVSTPRDIIYPIIIEGLPKTYELKAFSTIEAAEDWLLMQTRS